MTTNIDALPSQVTLETKEIPKRPQQLMSNKDAQKMVENLQIASNQKVTALPPRDVPMNTIQAALGSKTINKVVVSTDDHEIAEIAKKLNVFFFVFIAIPMSIRTGIVKSGSTIDILFQLTRSLEKGQKS